MPPEWIPTLRHSKGLSLPSLPFPWSAVKFHAFIILHLDDGNNFLTGVPISSGHPQLWPTLHTNQLYRFPFILSFLWLRKVLVSSRGGWSNMQAPQFSNQGSSMNGTHANCWTVFLITLLPTLCTPGRSASSLEQNSHLHAFLPTTLPSSNAFVPYFYPILQAQLT